jgi:hypothetical protein
MTDYDKEYYDWFKRFYSGLRANKAQLFLNNLELADITRAWARFRDRVDRLRLNQAAVNEAQEQLKIAQQNLYLELARTEDTKSEADAAARPWALKIYRNNRISEELKAKLDLPGPYRPPPPDPPTLRGEARADGTNYLEWDANGHPEGTKYVVKRITRIEAYRGARQAPVPREFDKVGALLGGTTERFFSDPMLRDGTVIEFSSAWYQIVVLDSNDSEIPKYRSNVIRLDPFHQASPNGFWGSLLSRFRGR